MDRASAPTTPSAPDAAADTIARLGRDMAAFGWVPATAGNISVPLGDGRIAVTRSGLHKGRLGRDGVMVVDAEGHPEDPALRPSAETLLHCGIYRRFAGVGAVLHGHSIANTVLSRSADRALRLQGYELLKVFPGLPTHEGAVEIPVFDNDQDIARLQRAVDARWDAAAEAPPGYLIRGHGVYVWGADADGALARLEALEFMLACELESRRPGS